MQTVDQLRAKCDRRPAGLIHVESPLLAALLDVFIEAAGEAVEGEASCSVAGAVRRVGEVTGHRIFAIESVNPEAHEEWCCLSIEDHGCPCTCLHEPWRPPPPMPPGTVCAGCGFEIHPGQSATRIFDGEWRHAGACAREEVPADV